MIEILLSSFNGEKYIKELLDSIIAQSYENWQLLIRDDGSKDSTSDIINKYEQIYPTKIKIINDGGKNLGSTLSFARLLECCQGEYIMLSDQDDVWLPNKIELTLNEIVNLASGVKNQPLMVFTDLKVVNIELTVFPRGSTPDSCIRRNPQAGEARQRWPSSRR